MALQYLSSCKNSVGGEFKNKTEKGGFYRRDKKYHQFVNFFMNMLPDCRSD